MKRLTKTLTLLLVLSLALVCLTGCQALDYRRAVDMYNRGSFDAAAELFATLGDYEDSPELTTRSHYWAAVTRMEQGKFDEALPRFLKLGDYEDSAQRVTECKYRLALAQFEDGELSDAEAAFREFPDYKQTPEYLRRINWQKLYDAVAEAEVLRWEEDGKIVTVYPEPDHPDQLRFSFQDSPTGEEDPYTYRDQFNIILSRDSIVAVYTAHSSFQFTLNGQDIGSQQAVQGKLDITTCTPETKLSIESFRLDGVDNQGNTLASDDPADCLMQDAMQEHLALLLTTVPQLLLNAGIEVTLADIGFYALA